MRGVRLDGGAVEVMRRKSQPGRHDVEKSRKRRAGSMYILRRSGSSLREIGRTFRVSQTTVKRELDYFDSLEKPG